MASISGSRQSGPAAVPARKTDLRPTISGLAGAGTIWARFAVAFSAVADPSRSVPAICGGAGWRVRISLEEAERQRQGLTTRWITIDDEWREKDGNAPDDVARNPVFMFVKRAWGLLCGGGPLGRLAPDIDGGAK